MNLIIKYVETRKPKEELDKTALEAADLSFDFLKESLSVSINRIKDLEEENKEKAIKIKELESIIEVLEKGEEDALRNP